MKALYKFEKRGDIRYISHLDLQRAMHRAVNRAQLPVKYSQGFHPLAEITFAQALALGLESAAEYMQIEFAREVGGSTADALNAILPEGLLITDFFVMDEKADSLMSVVAASRWQLWFPPGMGENVRAQAQGLLESGEVVVKRRTKTGNKPLDIRPGIISLCVSGEYVDALLAAGSVFNVRTSELAQALRLDDNTPALRTELYARGDAGLENLMEFYRKRIF